MRLPLRTSRLVLRRVRPEDADGIVSAIQFPDIAQMTLSVPYPYRRAHASSWIRKTRLRERSSRAPSLRLLITLQGRIIGSIGVHRDGDQAEIGYWLTPDARGQGYMSEAVQAMVSYAFTRWPIVRVIAKTFGKNRASQALLERNHFTRSAVELRSVEKDGQWHDVIVWTFDRPRRRRLGLR